MNLTPIIVGIAMSAIGEPFVMFAPALPAYEQPILKALGQIESGGDDSIVGRLGERSRYQILKATWKECSNKPFSFAYHKDIASNAAATYLNILSNNYYVATLRRPSELDLYVMWNWGFSNYRNIKFNYIKAPAIVRDAAERFTNLVYQYKNNN
jgi:hypothetical protein